MAAFLLAGGYVSVTSLVVLNIPQYYIPDWGLLLQDSSQPILFAVGDAASVHQDAVLHLSKVSK